MRRRLLTALALGALAVVCPVRCSPPTTLATFNIEMFPKATTDPERVAQLLADTDADVIAVQEIRDPVAFERVVELAATSTRRVFRASPNASANGSRRRCASTDTP